jgi:uncharacterized protein YecT (DUF1311 family)
MALPFPSLAVQKNCELGATNMAEIRYCESEQEKIAVRQAYEHLLQKLQSSNPAAAKLLVQAQKDWLVFAKSTCEYYTRVRTADAMANDFRSQCWADFSSARVQWLQASERDISKIF